jgi:hypothetical protein
MGARAAGPYPAGNDHGCAPLPRRTVCSPAPEDRRPGSAGRPWCCLGHSRPVLRRGVSCGPMPGTVSGGRLIAGRTEVSSWPARSAAWRCWCCSSALAVAAASRWLIERLRRTCARALTRRSAAYSTSSTPMSPPMTSPATRTVLCLRGSPAFSVGQAGSCAGPALCLMAAQQPPHRPAATGRPYTDYKVLVVQPSAPGGPERPVT